MPRRGSAKDEAIRRARAAKTGRDAARQHREALIESALTDYYLAVSLAEHARDLARRRAEALLAEAEDTAAPHDDAAAKAVRRLRELIGGVTETAALCGLTTAAIRDILAGPGPGPGRTASRDERRDEVADQKYREYPAGNRPLPDTPQLAGGDRDER